MFRLTAGICLALGMTAGLPAAEIQGVLADWDCVQPMVKNGRDKVLKQRTSCRLVQNYKRKAYGVITEDKKFYRLDDNGNQRAQELLGNSSDRDNLHVLCTGDLEGNTLKVKDMSIL